MTKRRKLDKEQCFNVAVCAISMILSVICVINSFNVESNSIEGLLHKNSAWLRWAFIVMVPGIVCGINAYFRVCQKKGKEVF